MGAALRITDTAHQFILRLVRAPSKQCHYVQQQPSAFYLFIRHWPITLLEIHLVAPYPIGYGASLRAGTSQYSMMSKCSA